MKHIRIFFLLGLMLGLRMVPVFGSELFLGYQDQGLKLQETSSWRFENLQLEFSPYLNYQANSELRFGLSEVYLDWGSETFGVSLGRKVITYGPGRYGFPTLGPLVVRDTDELSSGNIEGYDQLGYQFQWGNLNYHKFYAWVPENRFRMLLGQRATYALGQFTFGFSEVALVNELAPWFYYLPLPFVPIYGDQFIAARFAEIKNVNVAGNMAVDFDLVWQPSENFKLYAEYYMDDRPWPRFDKEWGIVIPEWDQCWWKCAYQVGFAWEEAFGQPDFKLYAEYTRVDQYTYTSWHPGAWVSGLDWTFQGKMIGDQLGSDADRVNLELVWEQSPIWQWSLAYIKKHHGEGEIGDQWQYVPGQTVVFLTGNVETTDKLIFGVKRTMKEFELGGKFGVAYVDSLGHQVGQTKWQPELMIYFKYCL